MSKPELGTKRLCPAATRSSMTCNKTPIVCPMCEAASSAEAFADASAAPGRAVTGPGRSCCAPKRGHEDVEARVQNRRRAGSICRRAAAGRMDEKGASPRGRPVTLGMIRKWIGFPKDHAQFDKRATLDSSSAIQGLAVLPRALLVAPAVVSRRVFCGSAVPSDGRCRSRLSGRALCSQARSRWVAGCVVCGMRSSPRC